MIKRPSVKAQYANNNHNLQKSKEFDAAPTLKFDHPGLIQNCFEPSAKLRLLVATSRTSPQNQHFIDIQDDASFGKEGGC